MDATTENKIRDRIHRRALRLIVCLTRARERGVTDPIPAIQLARSIGVSPQGSHETKRRAVRAAVKRAREILREHDADECLVANDKGYWFTLDRADLQKYLGRRRRAGLSHLAEHARTVRSTAAATAAGQGFLFDLSGRTQASCA